MPRRRGELGHPEVGDSDPSVASDEHVGGLDVEMEDAVGVRELERVRHDPDDGRGLVGIQRFAETVEHHFE